MAYDKKTWVNVPDPSEFTADELNSFPRFDAENMNRIESGIEETHTALRDKIVMGTDYTNNTASGGIRVGVMYTEEEIPFAGMGTQRGTNNLILTSACDHTNLEKEAELGQRCYYFPVNVDENNTSYPIALKISSIDGKLYLVRSNNGNKHYDKNEIIPMSEHEVLHTGNKNLIRLSDIGAAPNGHGLGDIASGTYDYTFDNTFGKGCGFYQIKDGSKSPDGTSRWFPTMQITRNKANGSEVGVQMAFLDSFNDQEEPSVWIRTSTLGVYSDWYEMLHVGNMAKLLGGDVLWENASPNDVFRAQTIEIDTTQYKRFSILVKHYNDLPTYTESICSEKDVEFYLYRNYVYNRSVKITDAGFRFFTGICNTNGYDNDSVLIPVKIVGYKY